ncbi:hypothetical protein AB6H12_08925 [Proteus mirabilis]
MDYRWISLNELYHDVEKHPENYSAWFCHILMALLEQFTRWSKNIT